MCAGVHVPLCIEEFQAPRAIVTHHHHHHHEGMSVQDNNY